MKYEFSSDPDLRAFLCFWCRIARAFLELYDSGMCDGDREVDRLSRRRRSFVDYVRQGQTELLMRLLHACGVVT